MNHSYILWIALLAYALHIVEEYTFDWKAWASNVLKLPVDWVHFGIVNGVVIVLGVSCASVAWSLPAFALSFPALMGINATFFHVLPFLTARGRFSSGLGTAIILFYPISIWAYYGAFIDGTLSPFTIIISILIGALLMASPVVMLKLRFHPYINQNK